MKKLYNAFYDDEIGRVFLGSFLAEGPAGVPSLMFYGYEQLEFAPADKVRGELMSEAEIVHEYLSVGKWVRAYEDGEVLYPVHSIPYSIFKVRIDSALGTVIFSDFLVFAEKDALTAANEWLIANGGEVDLGGGETLTVSVASPGKEWVKVGEIGNPYA